jgi:hypothetical protein
MERIEYHWLFSAEYVSKSNTHLKKIVSMAGAMPIKNVYGKHQGWINRNI